MVSVDPKAIRFLQPEAAIKEEVEVEDAEPAESSPEESEADESAEGEVPADSPAEHPRKVVCAWSQSVQP